MHLQLKKQDNKFKRILSNVDYIILTCSTIVSALLSFVYSVYAKKYVLPLDYGIYSTCNLLQMYMNYAQLGILNAYNRDYPQLLGAEKTTEAKTLRDSTITTLWIIYVFLTIVIDAVVLIIYNNRIYANEYSFGYFVIPFLTLLDITAQFSMYTTQMNGQYNYSAFVLIVKTVVSVGIGLFAIKEFNYYGLFVMPLIGSIVSILFYRKTAYTNFEVQIKFNVIKKSIFTGLPLLINSLIWTVMQSVDKFVILIMMTTEDLGLYTVPLMGFSTIVLVPQTISQVFYNKVSKLYGKTNDCNLVIDKCNYYTELTSALTGLVTIIAFYLLPIFVNAFMPNYSAGIAPAQILIIGVSLYSVSMLYGNIFSIFKMNKALLINSIVLCIFNIIFSTLFVLINGKDISNVAVGTSLSYFLYSVLLILLLSRKFNYSFTKLARSCWVQAFEALIPCICLNYIIKNAYVAMTFSLLIAIIFYLPLLFRELKKN